MNLQVTLIVIGLVVILAVYVISRIMEWKRTQQKAARRGNPAVENKSRNSYPRKNRFGFSGSQGKNRPGEIEPNFGEDDLSFMTETDVVIGVDPDDVNDRQLRPDEIESLTDPDPAKPAPVLSEARVVGQYHAGMRGAAHENHGRAPANSGGVVKATYRGKKCQPAAAGGETIREAGDQQQMNDMETDDIDAHGRQDFGSQHDDVSGQFRYPEIEGFIRVSQIDYWIKLSGKRDVGRESALALYREGAGPLTRQHQIFGQKIPEKDWRMLEREAEGARFDDLIITLQLADKNGAVDEEEMDHFVTLAKKLAKGIDYELTLMAPVESALRQGRAIADFIRHYDSLSIIHIKPAHAEYFEGNAINRCAAQLGLDRSPEGFFVRTQLINKNKTNLYYIANMSKTGEFDFDNIKDMRIQGVTFFTKPVLHRSPGVVFMEMSDTAKSFAARIKGNASAPDHPRLSQTYVDRSRALIKKKAREMEDLGIAPGNEEAMRLF